MIARHWRGWTTPANADAYETLLRDTVIPGLRRIGGYRGGHVLRRDAGGEVEFVVINFFDSLDSVRAFAGPDYGVAVFEPEAKRLLARAETHAAHYESAFSTVTFARAFVSSALSTLSRLTRPGFLGLSGYRSVVRGWRLPSASSPPVRRKSSRDYIAADVNDDVPLLFWESERRSPDCETKRGELLNRKCDALQAGFFRKREKPEA